jgi:chromosome segregation ATPase
MNRTLTWLNLAGVGALALLCVFQWRTNRALNLDVNALEKTNQLQAVKISGQQKNIQGLSADLENFRTQLTRAQSELRDTSAKLSTCERDNAQLTTERDQLKDNIEKWTAAVHLRDQRIAEANDRIREVGHRLKEGADKFNQLATRYNEIVKQMDELTAKYNALVTQLEEARGSSSTREKPKSS